MEWTAEDSRAESEKRYWSRFPKRQEQNMVPRKEVDLRGRIDPSHFVQDGWDWRGEPIKRVRTENDRLLPNYGDSQGNPPPALKSTQEIRAAMERELTASWQHPQDGVRNLDPRQAAPHAGVPLGEVLDNIASARGLSRAAVLGLIEALVAANVIRRT